MSFDYLILTIPTIDRGSVAVVRVVVVQTPVRVNDTLVVRVAGVRRAQPRVTHGTERIATALLLRVIFFFI